MATFFDSMVRDDRLFRSQANDAYTIAWGVSLYLAERDASHYMQYILQLSKLQAGDEYREESRIRDFHRSFNTGSRLLIQSADRFLHTL